MANRKTHSDRWDAALDESTRWRAYDAFSRRRYAVFLEWCQKEIPETLLPSRAALYNWAASMRKDELTHRLADSRRAQVEAGDIAAAGGIDDETLASALKALAADIVLRTGDVGEASALIKSAVSLRESGTKAEALKLSRDKFEFDAAKMAMAQLARLQAIAGNSELDEDQKIAATRAALFGKDIPSA